MWSPPVPAPSAVPVARGGVWGVLLFPPPPARAWPAPSPGQGCADGSRGWGKANLPKLKLPPFPSGRPGVLTPLPSLSQWAVPEPTAPAESPRRTKPAAEPYCPTGACRPGVACLACQYLLPPYVPSSGPPGLPLLPPGSVPPSPAGPPWTQPGQLRDQARTVGALPCASPPLASPGRPGPRMFRSLTLLLLF